MIPLPTPEPLFNPLLSPQPLAWWELIAGPLGLLAFLPFVPLLALAARRYPRTALILAGLTWIFATLGLPSLMVFLTWLTAAVAWITLLTTLRRRDILSERVMIALVWIGLHLLTLPFWWQASFWWYGWKPGRLQVLHSIGFAYLLLRLIAWGVDQARQPGNPLRLPDTACWLLYPPCMRNGPVVLRNAFFDRLHSWQPKLRLPDRDARKRAGFAAVGLIGLGILSVNLPHVRAGQPDFFTAPQAYPTEALLRVFYGLPILVYLFLWTYNEIASALAHWVGIPVENNFNWLPLATSVRDFWRRWHITVGAWLRSYVYIPLGGNRGSVPLHYAAVFGYCAIWHGATWSFVAWGATQVVALVVQRVWDRVRKPRDTTDQKPSPLRSFLAWLFTMHYQLATIIVFADFQHVGSRFFPELLRRLGLPG